MGNWCEKQTEEEEEKLLDDAKKDTDSSSKESEESDREMGGFEKEDGDDADSSGTHSSREIGSMAKLDTVLTVVQVNQDVGSEVHNLEIADNKFPEVSSPKAEDLQTAAHNQKINERNVEDEKTGSAHIPYLLPKIDSIYVEDPPKPVDLLVKLTTKKDEGGLPSSPKSEDVYRIARYFSLKRDETVEMVDPYPQNETVEAVYPSRKNETVEAVDPSLKNETLEAADPSLKNETLEAADPSLKNETLEAADPSLKNETVEAADPSLKNETVEAVDPSLKNETLEAADTSLKNETLEAADPSLKNETVEAADPSLKNETVEAADPSLKNETVEAADPSLKNETVEAADTLLKNETLEAADPSLKNETVEAADPSLKNETVEAADTLLKNETLEAADPSLKNETVEAADPSLKNETVEAADTLLKNETVEATDTSLKNETVEAADTSLKNETVEAADTSLKNETVEAADPSLKNETVEAADPSLKNETVEAADPSLKNETVEAADSSRKNETVEMVDPYPQSETVEAVDPSLKNETVEAADPSLKNETVEAVDPSLKNETVQSVDPSLKNETVEAVDPSLKNETVQSVDPSLKNETVEAEDPSLKNETVEMVDPYPQSETAEEVDPSLKNETVEAVDPSFKNETVEAADPSIKNETVEAADLSLKNETVEAEDPSLKNETVEMVDPYPHSETVEEVDPSLKNETVEAVDPSLKNETVEAADPSLKNETVEMVDPYPQSETAEEVDPSLKNEAVEAVDPSLKNKAVEAVDPSPRSENEEAVDPSLKNEHIGVVDPFLKSQSAQSEEPLTGTQDMKAKDPTPRTVDGPTVGPNAVFPDEASTHADHEPCMGNLSRPAHEEAAELVSSALHLEGDSEREDHDSEGDAPAAVRQTSNVNDDRLGINSSNQAKKPSLTDELGTSKRLEQEVRKDEGIGEEANEREDDGDKMTKACDNSSTQAQEEYSILGSPLIVEVKTEPLKSTDEEADRPAHEEAAELVSSALHLEGDSEREDHDSEGDAPAAVRQTSDVNDGSLGINSASQAKKPSLTDELGTSKRLEQEVRKDEGIGEEVNESSAMIVEEKTEPLKCPEPVKSTDGEADSDEDIYQAAEDIDKHEKIQITLPGVQDRSSVEPRVDILSYSQREWKGNTAKSALIRKGYSELSQCFEGLRKVRGDNYCALRATLFQILCHSAKLPAWIEDDDITLLPEKLAAGMEPIKSWRFPLGHGEAEEKEGAVERLKHHLKLLQKTWRAVAEAGGAEERRSLCEAIFRGGEEEHALLEAVKLLMLRTAAELHPRMLSGEEVPVFCWLLFARDSSQYPQTFLTNHLSHVGFSGGLEQVEMFLLGYALQHTIQVYRLYMVDTEEFITYYPNDHEEDWPHVCLVTEDDRHYNVLVGKLKGLDFPEAPTVD